MHPVTVDGLCLWQFDQLLKEPGVRHFVTDRRGHKNSKEFTLSYSNAPYGDDITANRRDMARALEVEDFNLYFPSQVHKTNIVVVNKTTTRQHLQETDALITNIKGLAIAVMAADCVPILLFDAQNNAVAAVHSGWRGTVSRILTKTLERMHATFGTKGEHVFAAIGPSVCQDSYEVGGEVIAAVDATFGKESGLLKEQTNGKAKLDLWKANEVQLLAFGIPLCRIEIAGCCTVKDNQYFFSARKGDTGRFAAGIVLA